MTIGYEDPPNQVHLYYFISFKIPIRNLWEADTTPICNQSRGERLWIHHRKGGHDQFTALKCVVFQSISFH